jgi:hypothetical protein
MPTHPGIIPVSEAPSAPLPTATRPPAFASGLTPSHQGEQVLLLSDNITVENDDRGATNSGAESRTTLCDGVAYDASAALADQKMPDSQCAVHVSAIQMTSAPQQPPPEGQRLETTLGPMQEAIAALARKSTSFQDADSGLDAELLRLRQDYRDVLIENKILRSKNQVFQSQRDHLKLVNAEIVPLVRDLHIVALRTLLDGALVCAGWPAGTGREDFMWANPHEMEKLFGYRFSYGEIIRMVL